MNRETAVRRIPPLFARPGTSFARPAAPTARGERRATAQCGMHAARGFTLIELVITVAIVGVLALGATPLVELTARRQREAELRTALRDLRSGIDAYRRAWDEGRIEKKSGDSGYPPQLEDLVRGITDAQNANGDRLYFLRRLPRDPFHGDPGVAAAATWGKRSYESPPDAPREGKDVFDVYSLSAANGLNGVPYREW